MTFSPIENLIPHRPPMQLVDALIQVTPNGAVARAHIGPGHLFGQADATLAPEALCELVAQCFAAGEGQRRVWAGKTLEGGGYLASLRDFVFLTPVRLGDDLTVSAQLADACFGTHIVHGTVRRGDEPVAQGTVYIFMWEGAQAPETL